MTQLNPVKPSRKEREHARHRQEILDAALVLFADHGFHETSMQMIADAAEFSVGYLYKHFAGKDEMFESSIDFHVEVVNRISEEVRSLGLKPLARVYKGLERTAEHFNAFPKAIRLFLQMKEQGNIKSCAFAAKQRMEQELYESFELARQAGELPGDCDVELLAAAYNGATERLMHVLAARSGGKPFEDLPDIIFSLLINPLRMRTQD